MALQIVRGKKAGAIRAVIYGTEGIGKSTLAAQVPGAVIIDTEDGTGQLDAARVIALDWRAIEHAVKELINDPQGFTAVVIDTADWLEKALIEFMLKQSGKKSIEDYGFGKGYTILSEHVVRFLALTDQLVAKGVHVVFVAHAKVTRTSPPDQTDGYDRYELKLTKQVAPLLKEWADLVMFCNYRIQMVEGSDGRIKAQGGKERIMHAAHSAAWDAKNRFGLPEEMPMEFSKIAHLFGNAAPRAIAPKEEPAPTKPEPAKIEESPATEIGYASSTQVDAIEGHRRNVVGASEIVEAFMEKLNAVSLDELTVEQAATLISELETITSKVAFAPNVLKWCEDNSDTATAYLRHVAWIEKAETWQDLTQERANQVADRFEKFKTAALTHAKVGRKAA